MYFKRLMAIVFNSTVEARYFLSTASCAAAFGFFCTHLAPLKIARVARAAVSGFASIHLPLAMISQQYSLASGVHSCEKPHIQALLDWFEEIHHQMVSDVIASEREVVLIVCPAAFHQFGLKALFLKNSFLVSVINRRFARQADVADANVLGVDDGGGGFLVAATQKHAAHYHSADD